MSGLLFEQIEGGATSTPFPPAVAHGTLGLRGFGFAGTFTALGGVGFAEITLTQDNRGHEVEVPVVAVGEGVIHIAPIYAFGPVIYPPADGGGTLGLRGYGYADPNFGYAELRVIGFAGDVTMPPPPPAPEELVLLMDTAVLAATPRLREIAHLVSALQAHARPRHAVTGRHRLHDTANVTGIVALVWRELLAGALRTGDAVGPRHTAIERAADVLDAAGVLAEGVDAVETVLLAAALVDRSLSALITTATDAVTAEALIAAIGAATERVASAFIAGLASHEVATLGTVLADAVLADATTATTLDAHEALHAAMAAGLRFSIDNGEYLAWVMNTESKGLTRYTQYPFNSFMRVAGRYYGATDTGVYLLEGDTDDGEAIRASLRTGLSNLGTRALKRLPSAYIGYRSNGDLLLKVVIANVEDGEREAHCYRLKAVNAQNPREGRVPVGRGLKAVYWDFVLENIDGAAVEIDTIELMPLVLERRVRGDSGGKR